MVNQQSVPITRVTPFCCPDPITVVFKIGGQTLNPSTRLSLLTCWTSGRGTTASLLKKQRLLHQPIFPQVGSTFSSSQQSSGRQHPCSYANQSGANFNMKSVMIVFPVHISWDQYRLCLYGSWVNLYCDTGAVVTFKPAEAVV